MLAYRAGYKRVAVCRADIIYQIGSRLIMRFRLYLGRALLLLLLLLFAAGLDADGALPQGEDRQPGRTDEPYSIQLGDRIAVFVLGRQDISGEYQVDMAGKIALPTIGNVVAVRLTTDQLGASISESAALATGESMAVSVTVGEYRPVYVLGDVKSSGSYAFMPGMTVLQAVAMAGGFFDTEQEAADQSMLRDGDEYWNLEAEHLVLSVRRQRLLAEKEGSEELTPPPELEARVADEPLLSALFDAEQQLLAKRRQELELKLQGYRRSRELFDTEAQALASQIEVQRRLKQLLEQQAKAVKDLMDKGMINRSIYLDMERQAAATKSDQRETQALLARAQQSSEAASQSALELEAERRQALEQAISDNARDLFRLERRMELSVPRNPGIRTDAIDCASDAGTSSAATASLRIIRRGKDGEEMVIRAERSDRLRPGDVIEVSIVCEDPAQG